MGQAVQYHLADALSYRPCDRSGMPVHEPTKICLQLWQVRTCLPTCRVTGMRHRAQCGDGSGGAAFSQAKKVTDEKSPVNGVEAPS